MIDVIMPYCRYLNIFVTQIKQTTTVNKSIVSHNSTASFHRFISEQWCNNTEPKKHGQ